MTPVVRREHLLYVAYSVLYSIGLNKGVEYLLACIFITIVEANNVL
jgi:hypothetical protein